MEDLKTYLRNSLTISIIMLLITLLIVLGFFQNDYNETLKWFNFTILIGLIAYTLGKSARFYFNV